MFDAAAIDTLIIPDFFKATAVEEGGRRFVYLEASNENRDYQNEIILASALAASADYYLRFGNIDLDHLTVIGPAKGIQNYPKFEIGKPVEVMPDSSRVWVKGEIFQGPGPAAENANMFWSSLTQQFPAQRWYPSVAGNILDSERVVDERGGRRIVKAVRWTNIGMSKTPVNLTVPTASVVPLGLFAKCWGPAGFDLTKALDSGGYDTDSATLTGGAALREQSLDHQVQSYWDFRDRLAGAIRRREVHPIAAKLTDFAHGRYGLNKAESAEWVERFLGGLAADHKARTAA